jgi:hypothetical protein
VAAPVEFTGNVSDLGNENGFQWEFRCNRCGNGFQSPFEQNVASRGRGALRAAGRWFGGAIETFSSGVESFNQYTYGAEQSATKDRAFTRAVQRVRPNFRQCRGCGRWSCAKFCWNEEVGQCMDCSPLVAEEIARAQADAQRFQFREQAYRQNWTQGRDMGQRPRLRCNTCGAGTSGGKFCQQCGQPLQIQVRCRGCGATASDGAMFCQQCGRQL